jgi:hypothetical protein
MNNPYKEWYEKSTENWVRRGVESVIYDYCDGTFGDCSSAHFIEYPSGKPKEAVERLVRLILDNYVPKWSDK